MPHRPLFAEIEIRTRALLSRAQRYYRVPMPAVEIRFDLRGRNAGMLQLQRREPPVIRYNPVLLEENRKAFQKRTVPHEVAHLVAYTLYGTGIRPHGERWKAVMRFFGAEQSRCHSYDVSRVATRQLQRFLYRCACREHRLTSIRHNRVRAGQIYYCRSCKQRLRPVRTP